jgi:hypothetical protein
LSATQRLPLNDPDQPTDRRRPTTLHMRPSLIRAIDMRRDRQTRAAWIEEAVRERIRREDDRSDPHAAT